jgi:hypothetical protein
MVPQAASRYVTDRLVPPWAAGSHPGSILTPCPSNHVPAS